MSCLRFFLFFLVIASVCSVNAYNINLKETSTSGLSSGGYMANQLHVAHSSLIKGVGILESGSYYCSRGSLAMALYACKETLMQSPDVHQTISLVKVLAETKQIDPISNLKNDKVFIFSGKLDSVVPYKVVAESYKFYQGLGVPVANIDFEKDVPVGHALPTLDYGNSCDTVQGSPYISSCNYDTAGKLLNHIYGNLNQRVPASAKNIFSFDQNKYINADKFSTADNGYAYVPTTCQNGQSCRIHIVFHGCLQTTEDIQNIFYTKTGFNEWAESNNLIVVYPQAKKDIFLNPEGCWDWWGYTGPTFHTKAGPQIQAIYNMIKDFSHKNFKFQRGRE